MRSTGRTHSDLPAPLPRPWLVITFIRAAFTASWKLFRVSATSLPSGSACALLHNSFPTLVPSSFSSPLSSHMRLLQLLLPQSAGPQLLLLSELSSFLVRYYFFLSLSPPCRFNRRSLRPTLHPSHSVAPLSVVKLIMSQHVPSSRGAGVPPQRQKVTRFLFSQCSRRGWSARRWPGTTLLRGT